MQFAYMRKVITQDNLKKKTEKEEREDVQTQFSIFCIP